MPRLTLTIADPRAGERADVLVDVAPGTTVGALAEHLAKHVRGGTALPVPQAMRPVLYVDGAKLDPGLAVERSALREGSLVSLDDPAGCLTAEPPGVVEVRVCGGPGAGVVHRLGIGVHDVGTAETTAVRLEAGAPRALTLTVGADGVATMTAYDGTDARLEGESVGADTRWPPGTTVDLGEVLLSLALPTPADAALEPSEDGAGLDYNRPPRLLPPVRQTRFTLPSPPREGDRRGLPIAMMVAPLGFAVVMAVAMNQPRMLAFGVFSPVMMLASYFSSKRHGQKSFRRQQAEYRERKTRIEADARAALHAEQEARRHDCPDPATALLVAVGPRSRLWERRRHDPDHLLLRVGTADLPSEVTLEDPEQDAHRRSVVWEVHDVPVTVPLRERGVVGIAGRGDLPRALGRWVVAQAATLHSPADVSLYVLTDASGRASWEWVRWLPHARPVEGQDTAVLVGTDSESVSRRVAELVAMVTSRRKALDDAGATLLTNPDVVVVLDGARRLRSLPGMVQVLREGPEVGVYAVCLDSDERLLPEECAAVVVEAPGGRVVVRQMRLDVAADVRPDLVSPSWAERLARALAPVRDVSGGDEDAALPGSSRLLDVLGLEPPTASAVASRWALQPRSTSFVVGESYDGAFAIDLVRDGPHGLVAGTTGAGKSELLQTIVASLAVANRPDAMTFVLVDYKGGAAFSQCNRLPHTVGMVTDLDTHLVERALESLGAELRNREHLLAGAGAKDIGDYVRRLASEPDLAPLPRLLIVIDEFASLVRELPDFVTGLVNIAQRGRSLGIHLLLATQRPSGVVSPEIKANTNLRIALRVTDTTESSDVIDANDAARISKSTPGRAYARLGHASLVPFQASRVGGRRPGAVANAGQEPFVSDVAWERLGRPWPARPSVRADEEEVTDLAALVDAVCKAAAEVGVPPQHRPWRPALAEQVLLDDLPPAGPGAGALAPVPYAYDDLPAAQDQRAAVLDLATFGHLVVAGAPRSGRSQVLRTIAGSVARTHSCADVHLYGIDCGNGALLPLAALPHCGAVVQRTQVERATRLITRLGAEVSRRQELLAEGGFADVEEQRAASAEADRLPHVVVLLDRWEGFTTTLGEVDGGRLFDEMLRLLREGASAGVHLVLAGDRSLLSGKVATMTEDKIALRLADRGDFSLIGLNPRKMPDDIPQGRGFRSETGIETQVALLSPDASGQGQAAALAAIAAEATQRDRDVPRARRPFRVDTLPSQLTFADAWEQRTHIDPRPLWGMVGVGGDELTAVGADLADGASFLVAGPPKSGRSTALVTMTRSFLEGGARVVLVTPQRSPLRDLDGTPGVLRVFAGDDLAADDLAPLLDTAEPLVLVVDDAEVLKECGAKDLLRTYVRTAAERGRGIVIAGNAADVASGFSGWQVEVKKARRGALLSPQDSMNADLVGLVRIPRSLVGQPVQPGRALVHLGDGELLTVQVPLA